MLHALNLLYWKDGNRCLQDQEALLEVSRIQEGLWESRGEKLLLVQDQAGWRVLSGGILGVEESRRCWVDVREL